MPKPKHYVRVVPNSFKTSKHSVTTRELLRHPLTIATFSFVLTGVIGALFTHQFAQITKAAEERKQEVVALAEATKAKLKEQKRAIREFSKVIYDRRTRAALLASSIRRDSYSEAIERKKAYDNSYIEWNKNAQVNLFIIRDIAGRKQYSYVEDVVERGLVQGFFSPIDNCVTVSFDRYIGTRSKEGDLAAAREKLVECDFQKQLKGALDCSYAITNGLYQLVSQLGELQIENEFKKSAYSNCGINLDPERMQFL